MLPALEPLEPHRSQPPSALGTALSTCHTLRPTEFQRVSVLCVRRGGVGCQGRLACSPCPSPPPAGRPASQPSPHPPAVLRPPPPGSQGALGTPLPHRRLAATELSRARPRCPPRAAHTLALAAPLVSCSTIEEDNDSGGFDALDLDGRCPVGPGGFTGALRIVGPQETRVQWIHGEPCAGARRPGLRP